MKLKPMRFLLITTLGLASSSLAQTIVYEDAFDGDGIDTNTNVGGGLVSGTNITAADPFEDSGTDLIAQTNFGNRVALAHTINQFDLTSGFTLEAEFTTALSDFGSNSIAIAIVDEETAGDPAGNGTIAQGNLSALLISEQELNAVGFAFDETAGASNPGTGLVTDFGTLANLSSDQNGNFVEGNTHTIVLTIEADGSGSFVIDPATNAATTFTVGTFSDLFTNSTDGKFHVVLRSQGNPGLTVSSITLTVNANLNPALDNPSIASSSGVVTAGEMFDLTISYDTDADVAELTTPSGIEDLIALDTDNDGTVILASQTLASDFLYEVDTSATGFTAAESSFQMLFGELVSGNTFSSAIIGDSPLFYYRYEEAVDSGFILDYSGNNHHTTDLAGSITLGSSPGGMQQAAQFALGAAIEVPATSEMSSSFTLVSVLNVNDFSTGALRNIFAMANGTGTGRSIFYFGAGGFKSFLNNTTLTLTDVEALPDFTSCLVHTVFDSDPDDDPLTTDGEMSVYVNGALYGSPVAVAEFPENLGEWVLGSNKNIGSQSFVGWLDETAVFESELSDAQIAAHATAFFAAADPLLGFSSDITEVPLGSSVELSWKVSDAATAVTINGDPVDGAAGGGVYTASFSPTENTTYTIEVTGPGGPFTASIEVTVSGPPLPLEITSITTDQATPPMVTITFTGPVSSSFLVTASSDLNDGFPETAVTVATDEFGEGSQTFPGVGTAEFYRLETP